MRAQRGALSPVLLGLEDITGYFPEEAASFLLEALGRKTCPPAREGERWQGWCPGYKFPEHSGSPKSRVCARELLGADQAEW